MRLLLQDGDIQARPTYLATCVVLLEWIKVDRKVSGGIIFPSDCGQFNHSNRAEIVFKVLSGIMPCNSVLVIGSVLKEAIPVGLVRNYHIVGLLSPQPDDRPVGCWYYFSGVKGGRETDRRMFQ